MESMHSIFRIKKNLHSKFEQLSKSGICPCRLSMQVGSDVGIEADMEQSGRKTGDSSGADSRYPPDERIEAEERSLLTRRRPRRG